MKTLRWYSVWKQDPLVSPTSAYTSQWIVSVYARTRTEAVGLARSLVGRGTWHAQEAAKGTRYRVILICTCANDGAYGYGATVTEARANAVHFFRKDHGRRAKWCEEIVEHAVLNRPDGTASHYEEMREEMVQP